MIRKQSPDTLRFLSMKICLWMNHVFLSIQLCQYLILIHKSSLIRVFTVNLLCHSGKPQIKIHARRYKNYFRSNLPCLPQCHTCFYSGSLCNIIRSQHNSMSCLRITTDCHWLSGKFRMMQFVIRKSVFFHIILSDCLKYPFRNLFFLLFCITHIVFESLPSFSCDP